MEIAIPIVALGGLYVINKHEKKEKEGYTNIEDKLPNTYPIPKNYPVTKNISSSNVNIYKDPNQITDKFFNPNEASKIYLKNNPPLNIQKGLDGKPINLDNFKHNNMVPFFGGKIKGSTVPPDIAEVQLDNLQGNGSQHIKKTEQAPLFKPQEGMQWAHGAPNMSEFYMSRVNPGMKMANVKPWEEEKVPPGLGLGYNTKGGPGYNSGVMDRNSWLPKTVNELRVDTNPKMTFGLAGHEGPLGAPVKDSGTTQTQGRVEKYRPDTYYKSGPERYFTTTGLENKPMARGIEVLQHTNRPETCGAYYGGANKEEHASYVKGEYQQSHRQVLPTEAWGGAYDPNGEVTTLDYGKEGYSNLPNNRSTTRQPREFGIVDGINGVMRSVIAPVVDILRPSRKENVIGNLRANGNAGSTVSNLPVFNPADRLKTTIKEMTAGAQAGKYQNLQVAGGGGYESNAYQPINNQRDSTNVMYFGDVGDNSAGLPVYDSAYAQRNNINKSLPTGPPNPGCLDLFSGTQNVCLNKRDPPPDNRCRVNTMGPIAAPSMQTYGKINAPQYYNECQGCDRIDSNILKAFKENPYTQSLHSWA